MDFGVWRSLGMYTNYSIFIGVSEGFNSPASDVQTPPKVQRLFTVATWNYTYYLSE